MRAIQNLNYTQIENNFASKLYGGGGSVTVKATITSNDNREIKASDYLGTYVDPKAGTSTTLDKCTNTSPTTVVCTGTATTI